MIYVNNISFDYPASKKEKNRIFHGLSFSMSKGQFVSILGRSGCGKTTLANILAGYVQPLTGSVKINDVRVKKPGRNRIMVNQEHDLFDWMTVEKNISIVEKDPGVISRLLTLGKLERYANLYPAALSGGLKKRLSLVRALAANPDFIILDEPFSSLDPITKKELQIELGKLIALTGKTTLLVTHDIEEAMLLSDRLIVLGGNPAKIQLEIAISLPRPRKMSAKTRILFSKIRRKVLAYLLES
ncbi:MAG: ABC-type nitrate/sulfonate/bicarbonate transport system, ATPase component [Candidatus Gottesmanbacteria bacterium GW2011_GWA2_47_9]|uniref:ABC-type nitrate/sulfonate/bicarbonate transport system, ATPase component n=2 Tax=Microgenomates group TaxID=1794810 RepID=A0A0G0UTK4_9BACT|nr:MAG: ABC-type nitrate/sulfonate/bicarbonate transport system, ATPase component [Candidatus Woesebacteria bacterium GW2011_GWA1_41_13b]KKU88388.1 MAG: ABC-type nitrate/sulfonate/bicarbonate transport system, ATPase component [Candidatus Gottesmanbacteria bacterium GW2011_GWA2_47_9]